MLLWPILERSVACCINRLLLLYCVPSNLPSMKSMAQVFSSAVLVGYPALSQLVTGVLALRRMLCSGKSYQSEATEMSEVKKLLKVWIEESRKQEERRQGQRRRRDFKNDASMRKEKNRTGSR